MDPFEYERAEKPEAAIAALGHGTGAKLLGGGTNLVDLMKLGVERPSRLVDIQRLELARIEPLPEGGLRLGALARNSDTANHEAVRRDYPLLTRAILAGASPQLRNMATNGGNLLQRTRCYYFMDTAFAECNKRSPGSGCAAAGGYNRIHAILGAGEGTNGTPQENCIATHPSDMCVALAALEAKVRVRGPKGERMIEMAEFHRLPGKTPQIDTDLKPDELILSIDLPKSNFAAHSSYLKMRDRASYAFALVSAAVGLEMDGSTVKTARIALGGVAQKPWRAFDAEKMLEGKPLTPESCKAATATVVDGAKTYEYNAFKVEMAKQTVARALSVAGGLA